ncbi:hypothetical protein BGZ98_002944 [Dissophora globulifera]|nr:hypothetical protein BGZ98_002944 [Dissophora globulifera]
MANPDAKHPLAEGTAGISSTSFLTPATNPGLHASDRQSVDYSDKVPQVIEWTSALSKEKVQIPPVSTSDLGQSQGQSPGALTPTSSSMPVDHLNADLEELHKLTPALVEISAPDIPDIQNLNLAQSSNPSYLSSKPYSVSGHYARGLDASAAPSPPSSIIAEPPSPTLSHASLKLGSTYSSTSSNAGEEDQDQDMEQDLTPAIENLSQDQNTVMAALVNSSISPQVMEEQEQSQNQAAFTVPRREILTKEDLELFHASPSYTSFFDFLEVLNQSVVGVTSTAECHQSDVSTRLMSNSMNFALRSTSFQLTLDL